MTMNNFLRNRESIRYFRDKKIPFKEIGKIEIVLDYIETETEGLGLKFWLYENGENLYNKLDGHAGYGGVMIRSPHYIVIEREDNDELRMIQSAYYTEEMITKLQEIGIDTCWVSLNDVDKDLQKSVFGDDIKEIDHIIAIGYGEAGWAFDGRRESKRKPIEEIVFLDELGKEITHDYLVKRGLEDVFYYGSFAPSNKNLQPWRFVIKEEKLVLYATYDNWEDFILIDMGIIMYYFQYLIRSQGIECKWDVNIKDEFIKDGNKYREIGTICI